jgi:hypothetical protein
VTRPRNKTAGCTGGHVSQSALSAALPNASAQRDVVCTLSNDPRHTHFKFALELCSLVLFQGILPDKVKLIFFDIHSPTERMVLAAIATYFTARGLVDTDSKQVEGENHR